jgi:hypothetical protein
MAAVAFTPMRAIRVGYLSQCLLFLDANSNSDADLSEEAQPTTPVGAVTLFGPGGEAATALPLLEDAEGSTSSSCEDGLTLRRAPNVLLRAAPGVPRSCLNNVLGECSVLDSAVGGEGRLRYPAQQKHKRDARPLQARAVCHWGRLAMLPCHNGQQRFLASEQPVCACLGRFGYIEALLCATWPGAVVQPGLGSPSLRRRMRRASWKLRADPRARKLRCAGADTLRRCWPKGHKQQQARLEVRDASTSISTPPRICARIAGPPAPVDTCFTCILVSVIMTWACRCSWHRGCVMTPQVRSPF